MTEEQQNIDFPEVPDTDFSLAQNVYATIKALKSVREDRRLTKEEYRVSDALNSLWFSYGICRQKLVLDVTEIAARGFIAAVIAVFITMSAAFADVVEVTPPQATAAYVLVDNEPKQIEGLRKVDRASRKFKTKWYHFRGPKRYHYKLKDTNKELISPAPIKTCADLRPDNEAHPIKHAAVKVRNACEFVGPVIGIGTQLVIWYGQAMR